MFLANLPIGEDYPLLKRSSCTINPTSHTTKQNQLCSLICTNHLCINTQMASFTFRLSIGDFLTPIKDTLRSFIPSKDQRDAYVRTFDMLALRTIMIMILFSSMVLMIMCIPYVFKIIESLFLSLHSLPKNNPKSMSSFIQLTTLLPLLFILMD